MNDLESVTIGDYLLAAAEAASDVFTSTEEAAEAGVL
jgi:hypothetical protein